MASDPNVQLDFPGGCPDCGRRRADLPQVLPQLGDDFDWDLRDYDGFRLFMLEALAARFPERRRLTPADVEVALAEVLAAQLDKLSDMLDRVAAEFTLETARRPETVRRLLALIGYDALTRTEDLAAPPFDHPPPAGDLRTPAERLDQYWLDQPERMDLARLDGPRAIRDQHRMVTLEDFMLRLEDHPLVERAHAWDEWSGAWQVIRVAVIPILRRDLDTTGPWPPALAEATQTFHAGRALPLPDLTAGPSLRAILLPYVAAYRLTGQPVELERAQEVGVIVALSIQVAPNHYQSEVRDAVLQALGTGPGGFFAPGRLRFGEDLWASDIIQNVVAVGGVDNVCLNRFKRLGNRFADQAGSGRIELEGLEVAICDNLPGAPERGYLRLALHGGMQG